MDPSSRPTIEAYVASRRECRILRQEAEALRAQCADFQDEVRALRATRNALVAVCGGFAVIAVVLWLSGGVA